MTGKRLDKFTLRKIQKIEDEVIKFDNNKPYVDIQFLKFGVDVMKFLTIEEQTVMRLIVTHPRSNPIKLLRDDQKETLLEIIEKHTIPGHCCFCHEKFTWRDAPMTIGAVHKGEKGHELHHRRCYPRNCRYNPTKNEPYPTSASQEV